MSVHPIGDKAYEDFDWAVHIHPADSNDANIDPELLIAPNAGNRWFGNFVREFAFDGPKSFLHEFVIRKGMWKVHDKLLELNAGIVLAVQSEATAGKLARGRLGMILPSAELEKNGGVNI